MDIKTPIFDPKPVGLGVTSEQRISLSGSEHLFEIGEGEDRLVICYAPAVILELADAIRNAQSLGLADPLPEILQTDFYGSYNRGQ